MLEVSGISDALAVQTIRGRGQEEMTGLFGFGVAELFGPDGELKQRVPFKNRVTTAGDQYFAQMGITTSATVPTRMSGMKLGTGVTAAAKSGAGAALVTYTSGSQLVFDGTYPQAASNGGDTGWNVVYKCTWGTGVATVNGLAEVVVVNDAASNATSTAANTVARALLSPTVNKGASDTLAVTWTITLLGA